ncbi:hypothetical protein [Pseudomonas chlororaphis]|uniref:hypothetical protein n=1 Tax=Pseudomonas chlororaphis TaxID=587753 RepID=UPI0009C036F7|nr:hypothetical protein [Pseudomonas chlororaphis]QIT25027.1 hypothetical protein HCN09_25985 [Pseudomonas chlororaphis subsp. aurantiaca]WDH03140.1 hypothetical protein PUP57_27140 [Pseudomonas chlororaphis]WDH08012.1 hypothetical protein PUP64_19870 [Pseudomonas chlororaphis]
MRKILLAAAILLCTSCAKDHGKPSAVLEFSSVARVENLTSYTIHYSSDIDLLDLYGRGRGNGQILTQLRCALGADQDFSVGHFMEPSIDGLIEEDSTRSDIKKFSYLTQTLLSDSFNPAQPELNIQTLDRLLAGKKTIPCKAIITAYGYKTYYSKPMELPVKDLLREINKPKTP